MLVTYLIVRKSEIFHYIICRTDKIMLLLVMATYQLRRYQKCLSFLRQRKRRKCELF